MLVISQSNKFLILYDGINMIGLLYRNYVEIFIFGQDCKVCCCLFFYVYNNLNIHDFENYKIEGFQAQVIFPEIAEHR